MKVVWTHKKLSFSILENDIRLAINKKAYMLAFLGVCAGLDILAKEFYLNEKFKIDHTNAGNEPDLKERFSLFVKGKLKKTPRNLQGNKHIFIWALDSWMLGDKDLFDAIYDFRCNMVHAFNPAPFELEHQSSGEPNIFIEHQKKAKRTVIYLPEFFEFYETLCLKLHRRRTKRSWIIISEWLKVGEIVAGE